MTKSAAPRKGFVALDALKDLIIVVVLVLIAVIVLVNIWNTFFGKNTIEEDVQGLAAIIEDMAKSDSTYEQKGYLLQLEDYTVFGFDKSEKRHPMCGDNACICKGTQEMLQTCFQVEAKEGQTIVFAADFTGFVVPQNAPVEPKEMLKGERTVADDRKLSETMIGKDTYHQLRLHQNYFKRVKTNTAWTVHSQQTGRAVIPLVVEKITVGNVVHIIVMHDSQRARARAFYGFRCAPSPLEQENICAGKTGYTSMGEASYCGRNIFNDKCTEVFVPVCKSGRFITSPCLCEGKIVSHGICALQRHQDLLEYVCAPVVKCTNYCTMLSSDTFCDGPEAVICKADPCRLPESCVASSSTKVLSGVTFLDGETCISAQEYAAVQQELGKIIAPDTPTSGNWFGGETINGQVS